MGSGRNEWPPVMAGSASTGLYGLAHGRDALGGATATAQSTRSLLSTRPKPAGQESAVRKSSCTSTDASGGVVAVAPAGHAFSRASSAAGAHGASQSSLL